MANVVVQNVLWNLDQVFAFIAEARSKPSRHRSRYYKAAFFFSASVVEAIVFILVKNFCLNNSVQHRNEPKYTHIYTLPEHLVKSIDGEVGIYEKKEIKFEWKDNMDWNLMNEIGYKYNVFDKRLFHKLDRIRDKRNNIHLQSLKNKDHRYTKKDIEYATSVLPKLIDKLTQYVTS